LEKFLSFDDIKKSLENRETDCKAIVNYYLQNIQTKAHLNAFVEVYKDSALAQAAKVMKKSPQEKPEDLPAWSLVSKMYCLQRPRIQCFQQNP
jgi:Asp-tRNA(Asn)/Glu-tRNA(Gln) amidotransferase A subunit family amidase